MRRMRIRTANAIEFAIRNLQFAAIRLRWFCCRRLRSRAIRRRRTIDFWAIGSEGEQVAELVRRIRARESRISTCGCSKFPGPRPTKSCSPHSPAMRRPTCASSETLGFRSSRRSARWSHSIIRVARSQAIQSGRLFLGALGNESSATTNCTASPGTRTRGCCFIARTCWRQAGFDNPPETWDEWLTAMRQIKRKVGPNRYAILIPTNEWEHRRFSRLQTGTTDAARRRPVRQLSTAPSFARRLSSMSSLFAEGLAPPVTNTEISNCVGGICAAAILRCTSPGRGISASFAAACRRKCRIKWATAPLPRPDGKRIQRLSGGRQRVGDFPPLGTSRGGVAVDRVSLADRRSRCGFMN